MKTQANKTMQEEKLIERERERESEESDIEKGERKQKNYRETEGDTEKMSPKCPF